MIHKYSSNDFPKERLRYCFIPRSIQTSQFFNSLVFNSGDIAYFTVVQYV